MERTNPVLLYSEQQVSEENRLNPCLLCFGLVRVDKPQCDEVRRTVLWPMVALFQL